jgi:hypothetical protein
VDAPRAVSCASQFVAEPSVRPTIYIDRYTM